jgi:beta-glucosidase
MPWGVEDLSIQERYAKAVAAGTDLFSGSVDVDNLKATYEAGMITDEQIDRSVTRLLVEKFRLGLFENPYVDPDKAEKTANCDEFRSLADKAFRKSIVLMKNDGNVLPLKEGTKVYFERMDSRSGAKHDPVKPEGEWNVQFVDNPKNADAIVLWLFPGAGGGFLGGGGGAAPISNLLSANSMDIKYINSLAAKKPTTVIVNCSKPWVLNELSDKASRSQIATFGTTLPAVMDVLTGKFNPTGKMPFALPSSQEAVENNKEDVPGSMEAEGYALIPC